jgi:hypothetical protein
MPLRPRVRRFETLLALPSHKANTGKSQLRAWAVLCALAIASSCVAFAQSQSQTPPDAPSASKTAEQKKSSNQFYNLLDRKSFFFPDIATSTQRLSPGGKFKLFVANSVSLSNILFSGVSSAVSQADDSPTGFGQGWDAYGKRFGSSMARSASSEFFGTFVLASALHEDPRFYPQVNPSFGSAVGYSLERVFITRNDDGRDVANISGLLGPLAAEGLANVYWPDRNRTAGDTFMRYGIDIATRAGGNLFRNYWPVLYHKMHHSSQQPQPSH